MRFELSEEHKSLRKIVRDCAVSEVARNAAEWDQSGVLIRA